MPTYALAHAPAVVAVDLQCGVLRSPTEYYYSRSFGVRLIPGHLRRPTSRPVSFYALFKWWLLLSQHPGCHGNKTSSITKTYLGTLAGDQGCFPFDLGGYPPRSHSRITRTGIRSLIEAGSLAGPCPHSVALPPDCYNARLSQKTFRGVPDISTFD